jgi:hypothetical protein
MSFAAGSRLYPVNAQPETSTMTTSLDTAVVLIVRGTLVPKSNEEARSLHNQTAGSDAGKAAARACGDLSHKVYTSTATGMPPIARSGELLFVDVWADPRGLMEFFSNPDVQAQAAKLFAARDASVWMPARGSSSYHLPAPAGRNERFVGVVRAPIASPQQALEVFRAVDTKAQRDARRRGLMSHELFIKVDPPGQSSAPELLGIDVWHDLQGMTEHYSDDTHMSGLRGAFAGMPETSIWSQAAGLWSEW